MGELNELVSNLKEKQQVDAVFVTGSMAVSENSTSSDIDLVVILEPSVVNIRSVYQLTDGVFTDIFFFDTNEIDDVKNNEKINASGFDGMLVSWLQKADVKFDKSGKTTEAVLVAKTKSIQIFENELNNRLNTISYDKLKCSRYFSSGKQDYLDALEIMLPNAVIGLLIGFLVLRNVPWRGEKLAVKYIKENCIELYKLYFSFINSSSLNERMDKYFKMIDLALPGRCAILDYKTPLALSRGNSTNEEIETLGRFWNELSSNHVPLK